MRPSCRGTSLAPVGESEKTKQRWYIKEKRIEWMSRDLWYVGICAAHDDLSMLRDVRIHLVFMKKWYNWFITKERARAC